MDTSKKRFQKIGSLHKRKRDQDKWTMFVLALDVPERKLRYDRSDVSRRTAKYMDLKDLMIYIPCDEDDESKRERDDFIGTPKFMGRSHCFELICGKRNYFLSASDLTDFNEWIFVFVRYSFAFLKLPPVTLKTTSNGRVFKKYSLFDPDDELVRYKYGRHGFLKKRGAQFNKSFKMRYFRMETKKPPHTYLCYYASPDGGSCAGQIELQKCFLRHNDADKPLEFLLTSGERQFILQASSLKDKAMWMESLAAFTRQLPTEGAQSVVSTVSTIPTTPSSHNSGHSDPSSDQSSTRHMSSSGREMRMSLSGRSFTEAISSLGLQDHLPGSEKARISSKVTAVYRPKKDKDGTQHTNSNKEHNDEDDYEIRDTTAEEEDEEEEDEEEEDEEEGEDEGENEEQQLSEPKRKEKKS